MKKLINEAVRMQHLAGILKEDKIEENKIQEWIDENAGGYGPSEDEEPEQVEKMKQELNVLPKDNPQFFIEEAVGIIFEYTKNYYGDDTSFSPDDIKQDFYDYIEGKIDDKDLYKNKQINEHKNKSNMELINEAKRFQKLAGLLTEGEIEEMNNLFEDEPLEEEEIDEMARTAGTGGSYTITPEGEAALKQAKATNQLPEGLKGSQLAILIFLFKAKKEGKRVQKIDYAAERGVPQPAVNSLFNELEGKGLVTKEGYTSAQKEPAAAKPKADLAAILGGLDLD